MSDDERTIWCGNLSEKVSEELLYELFLQAGPVDHVKIPRDKDRQKSFGFVTFTHACSVDYALLIFEGTKLFHRPLAIHRRGQTNGPQNQRQMNFVYPQSPMNPSVFVNSANSSPKIGQAQNLMPMMQQSPEPLLNRMNNPFSNVHPDILRHLGSQMMNPFLLNMDEQQNFQNKISQRDERNQSNSNKPYSRGRNDNQKSHNQHYNNNHSNKNNKDRHGNNRHSNNYKR